MILNLPPTTIQIESSVERISRYKKTAHEYEKNNGEITNAGRIALCKKGKRQES